MKKMNKEEAQQLLANAKAEARIKYMEAYDFSNRWHKKHDLIFWAMFLGIGGMFLYALGLAVFA